MSNGQSAAAVIEYALWTDWDIQHLCELEHVWSYVDDAGRLIHAEASWHGEWVPLVQAGHLSAEGNRPVAFAQPGKHAMSPDPRVFTEIDAYRLLVTRESRPPSRGGLHVVEMMRGRLRPTVRGDALARAYLHTRAFEPTFRFGVRWDARLAPFEPAERLVDGIPGRIRTVLQRLAADRQRRRVWALLFDLGDTLMVEETEEKDATGTTLRAELFAGAAELVGWLRREGYLLGLVADTRIATVRNVLCQHDLADAFDVLAISESVGVEKPDAQIFRHALSGLGLHASETGRVMMVGNRLDRDVRGANQIGLTSVWIRLTDHHVNGFAEDRDRPHHTVASYAELRDLLQDLG